MTSSTTADQRTNDEGDDTPFFLQDNFAPVEREVTAHDLEVVGELPAELVGRYLRNGPNPRAGTSPHWFLGDGMLHGMELAGGRARWYRNRWVRTRALTEPDAQLIDTSTGTIDRTVGVSNTHVVEHAGRILALVESSFPCEVTGDLSTVGPYDYEGRLQSAMTAHPKQCPTTGELHFFGYGFLPPYLTYHRADATGQLVESQEIDVPGATMMHDFALTDQHVIFLDFPVVFDLQLALSSPGMPYRWDPAYGARIGVMPRATETSPAGATQWFEIDPCYVFHTMNAWTSEDGRSVQLDAVRYPSMWQGGGDDFSAPGALVRWTLDLVSGQASHSQLDDLAVEFPRIREDIVGKANRYGYTVANDRNALVKYDVLGGSRSEHDFGDDRTPAEAAFVPAAAGRDEDDGWLMTYVYDRTRDTSDFVVLDATDVTQDPVAVVPLPQRVPYGFHGSWIPDAS